MRVIFFGTPTHAAKVLRSIVEDGHEVVLVVTQPDRKRGRGGGLVASPVKAVAEELGLPVTHRVADVIDVQAEIGVLVAFGRMIKPEILRHVTILNLHPSLLPRWRGATPAEAAILAGDKRTGICVMQLVEEMDAGPVYARMETEIRQNEHVDQLYPRLFAMGTELLLEQLRYGLSTPESQIGEVTYCGKFSAEDFHIDWQKSARELNRLTRVGKTWTTFRGKRFLILASEAIDSPIDGVPGALHDGLVVTGDGLLRLLRVQPEGKAAQEAESWLRGARVQASEHFI